MIVEATALPGVFIVEPELHTDERGHFGRTFCVEEFATRGLNTQLVQCSTSWNERCGTLRGLHWQAAPHGEDKLIRCTSGAVFDVAVDLRPGSPSYGRWISVRLDPASARMIYIPKGCAHGFQTLEDSSEVFYQMSAPYRPRSARGVRWDDPTLAIAWPVPAPVLSARDAALPLLAEIDALALAS